jgi:hypothetical protein
MIPIQKAYFCASNATVPNVTTYQSTLLALKACISHGPHNVLTTNWSTNIFVCI